MWRAWRYHEIPCLAQPLCVQTLLRGQASWHEIELAARHERSESDDTLHACVGLGTSERLTLAEVSRCPWPASSTCSSPHSPSSAEPCRAKNFWGLNNRSPAVSRHLPTTAFVCLFDFAPKPGEGEKVCAFSPENSVPLGAPTGRLTHHPGCSTETVRHNLGIHPAGRFESFHLEHQISTFDTEPYRTHFPLLGRNRHSLQGRRTLCETASFQVGLHYFETTWKARCPIF